jgi:hypothetical protein
MPFLFFVLLQKTITMLVLLLTIACCVHGAVVINIVESGGNVVATGSGTIDLTGASLHLSDQDVVAGAFGQFAAIVLADGNCDLFNGLSGPASFGSSGMVGNGAGDVFGIDRSSGRLVVPAGYTSGNQLSGSLTLSGATFGSLGLTPGTYVYTWASDSLTVNIGVSGSGSGDPHLVGANGITFDVYGKPAANYSLLVAPAFEVNMQLADRGPEMRFMTSMAVLYQGTSFIITPWTVKSSAELVAHFEALGAKVNIDEPNWIITIELCAGHTIMFATRHSDNINFLNFDMRVPGCHNAYGGLLGQTFQCKYASEKFEWSREREEAFRVATLETASDTYSPVAKCTHQDEYRGEAIRGGSFSNGTLSMTTML